MSKSKKLLIVESPAKAKTIGKYLGKEFTVKSSVGHIRDLPKESGAIRIAEKGPGKWEFIPTYVISDGKKKVVAELKAAVKASSSKHGGEHRKPFIRASPLDASMVRSMR